MQAQIIEQYGDPTVFQTRDVAKPLIKPGHVIIKVAATSVNPLDLKIRSGLPEISPALPAILHGDVAGTIVETGAGVDQFKIGDEVYGFAGGVYGLSGALAEFMLADAQLIAIKPKTLSLSEAAALPVIGITAWQSLFQKAQLKPGQTILIQGGTGGVGHIAVQLAKAAGARVVTTVVSDKDIVTAQKLGADVVINVKNEAAFNDIQSLTDGLGFDIIFDTVGGANLQNSFAVAAPDGVVVTIAARATVDLTQAHNKGLSLHVLFTLNPLLYNKNRANHGATLASLKQIIDAGKVKPILDSKEFFIDEVGAAHAYVESGQASGKVVLLQR